MKLIPLALRIRARALKSGILTLYYALRHRDTPWHARFIAGLVMIYAVSPVDLVPDFLLLFGFLDDLVVIPLGITLARRQLPAHVLAESEIRAEARLNRKGPSPWLVGALVVLAIWIGILLLLGRWLHAYLTNPL